MRTLSKLNDIITVNNTCESVYNTTLEDEVKTQDRLVLELASCQARLDAQIAFIASINAL